MSVKDELLAIKGDREFLIVEEAHEWAKRNPKSELYASLEWNESKAAMEYRLSQIRRLIAIHITFEEGDRRMVSLSIDRTREGGGYRDVNDVLASQSLHQIMLDDALRELDRMQAKYDRIKELKPLWKERDQIRRRAAGKKEREGRRAAG